jgi:hexosaminidase
MKRFAFAVTLFFALISNAQEINIIPQPASIKQPKIAAKFSITQATLIVLEGSNTNNAANFLNDYLQQFYHFKLKVVKNASGNNAIRLNYERLDNPIPGAYQMTVNNKGVYIAGDNETGVFYGVQTLIQLLPTQIPHSLRGGQTGKSDSYRIQIPFVSIKDAPRFPYRGMHLDVGRHFFTVSFVKKYIEWLALYKMNYFHWHLTEDQGWRIEIKKYPGLTEASAWRNGTIIGRFPGTGNDGIRYGGYYTQDEIKEVVAYAAKRYITVIPEIEMPGHCSAAIAAYPWLSCFPNESTKHPPQCAWNGDSTGKQVQQTWGVFEDVYCAGKDSTFKFLQDVLDEVIALFPSKYIHVGGDECPKANWKRCPLCQKRIKDEGLKDEHELQSYFIQRMEKYLNSKGRTLIGWDEILEGGLAPNAVVMSWRGEAGGIAAARQTHDVVMTPGAWVYFDHSQTQYEDSVTIGGYTPVEKTYSYEPVSDSLTKEQGKYILGAQGNVWTEYMSNDRKVEYMIFPRISALSEVLWSPKEKKDSSDFEKRLIKQFKRYDLWKVNYSKAYFDLKAIVLPTENHDGILYALETKLKSQKIIYRYPLMTEDGMGELQDYKRPILIKNTIHIIARAQDTIQNISSNSIYQIFRFNRATGKKITLTNPPSERYPGDGAFTLVNGIQNEKGLLRSREFLGFNGTDCQAIINLDSFQTISSVTVYVFQQKGSQIWPPLSMEAFASDDGQYFSSLGKTDSFNITNGGNGTMTVKGTNTGRFVKLVIKNQGTIPEGNPGAGNKAWLLVDEIEVN